MCTRCAAIFKGQRREKSSGSKANIALLCTTVYNTITGDIPASRLATDFLFNMASIYDRIKGPKDDIDITSNSKTTKEYCSLVVCKAETLNT